MYQSNYFDISLELNFSSQQSFNRTFTSHFGCAPLQYRSRKFLGISKLYLPYTPHSVSIPLNRTIHF
ncbi:AraC family transcriptional regulator [Raoultella planticola]|uniref:AraC family transcriptional regulator n=1 Tax=Raoultella planticola TaxID=575 RepID=UPI0013E097B3|nr:AraC family transcriptional regulator [Raoultella planticola]HAT1672368.1 AraC family transcriptional regulator [Raoultella planticola]